MDPVQFLKCISFFSLDRIIIYWNRLYDLRSLVGLPVWFCWTKYDASFCLNSAQYAGSKAILSTEIPFLVYTMKSHQDALVTPISFEFALSIDSFTAE